MSSILKPGADPPIVTPYCSFCDMPAERFCMDVLTSPYYVGIHAQCCGKTQSVRISVEELFRIKRTNDKLYVVVGKGRAQGIRGSGIEYHR